MPTPPPLEPSDAEKAEIADRITQARASTAAREARALGRKAARGDKPDGRRVPPPLGTPKPSGRARVYSRYHGVVWRARLGKWEARIKINGEFHSLGLFAKEIDAARAYDAAAIRVGLAVPGVTWRRRLNFPKEA